ncbi:MAG: Crp/Fnr family transcriptional regulator [Prevotella sp.]|nr:Crp/Fnr family transcriptional regulator [Prevotella sp.]
MEEKYQSTEHCMDLGRLHDFIRQHGEAVDYQRGERLETEGEPARWCAFVERGQFKYVMRGISDGREHNTWFSLEGELVGAYPDMMEGRPSQATIQAMKVSRVVRISGEQLLQFFRQNTETMELRSLIAEHILRQFQIRSSLLLIADSHERYLALLRRCPGIVHDVPLKELASFIGVTRQMLSKIRKEITFEQIYPP